MAKRIPSTRPRTASAETATRQLAGDPALAALLHRLNGGLNNAAIAFDILHASRMEGATGQVVTTGMAGVAQASRAAKLIDAILSPDGVSFLDDDAFYVQDVVQMLRENAARAGCNLRVTVDVPAGSAVSCTPRAVALSLTRGLAAIARGGDGPLNLVETVRDGVRELVVEAAPE